MIGLGGLAGAVKAVAEPPHSKGRATQEDRPFGFAQGRQEWLCHKLGLGCWLGSVAKDYAGDQIAEQDAEHDNDGGFELVLFEEW